ncbi:MAG: hypothetical protein AB7V39_00575 [Nitrospiraceae bacterium]
MSRSFRKRPYVSLFGYRSEKDWKQISSRVFRRVSKQAIQQDQEPLHRDDEAVNKYSFPSDGTKGWRKDGWWSPAELKKQMRK